jgi:5-methylcytosine-specific restriction endonuclease McrA
MHLLAHWLIDNYLRDLDEGAGFNFNSRQARLHSEIDEGQNLWLFTRLKSPPRYYLVAKLVVRSKTINAPGFKYGAYRVWGDLHASRYFRVRPDHREDEAFEVLRGLPLATGPLADCDRVTLAQSCQSIRGLTAEGNELLEAFARSLPDEERAALVIDEYELERAMQDDRFDTLADTLRSRHRGASEERIARLLAGVRRNRALAREIHQLYKGRCQLCAFDGLTVYGVGCAETHHIVHLSRGGEDSRENLLLLCPNHHTVVHKTEATFDYGSLRFLFPNGRAEPLCLNTHLQPRA